MVSAVDGEELEITRWGGGREEKQMS